MFPTIPQLDIASQAAPILSTDITLHVRIPEATGPGHAALSASIAIPVLARIGGVSPHFQIMQHVTVTGATRIDATVAYK